MQTKNNHTRYIFLVGLGILITIGLLAELILINSPQELRRQAASECFLAIKTRPGKTVGLVQGVGGVVDGLCVGGVGNQADKYSSYYRSRAAGEADLEGSGEGVLGDNDYPCKSDFFRLADKEYYVGGSCQVNDRLGNVLCVGGPESEFWGCLNTEGGNHYLRLGEQSVSVFTPPEETPPSPFPSEKPDPLPPPTNCSRSDLNCDGSVDLLDYQLFLNDLNLFK